MATPLARAVLLLAADADVILERTALAVRQVRELHRQHFAARDHAGAEAGAETEEEHLAALHARSAMAADRLHRSVVEQLDRHAERAAIVEVLPTRPEVHGILERTAVLDRRGQADGDRVDLLAAEQVLHVLDQLLRRVGAARIDLALGFPVRALGLGVGATDIEGDDHARSVGGVAVGHGPNCVGQNAARVQSRGVAGEIN